MRFSWSRMLKREKPEEPLAAAPPVSFAVPVPPPVPESFLRHCRAIIHLGANSGQERDLYQSHDLDVLWIEALPAVFEQLKANIAGHPRQAAVQALVSDLSGEKRTLNVSNNEGLSSSLFELADHKKLWPEVSYSGGIELVTSTLDELVADHWKEGRRVDALVMDIQGAELLALRGGGKLLREVRFIKAEAADFEAYAGACSLETLDGFLTGSGFRITNQERFAGQEGVGSYFDVLWERTA